MKDSIETTTVAKNNYGFAARNVKYILFFLVCLSFLMATTTFVLASSPTKPHTFQSGTTAQASQVNENFDMVYQALNALVPVGSVISWNKQVRDGNGDVVEELSLPIGWVECNGQILDQEESPFHGNKIPDLNGATAEHGTQGLFIRGGAESGIYQDDQMQSHKHTDSGHSHGISSNAKTSGGSHGAGPYPSAESNASISVQTGHANLSNPVGSTAGAVRHGDETRPKNMSMVWIIRVK